MAATALMPRAEPAVDETFARDVAQGLGKPGQKTLPPSWFYDDVGSALFEVITRLPEYGVTRAEEGLLAGAADRIVREAGSPRLIVELGSGSGLKTSKLLRAAMRQTHRRPVRYIPVDVSEAALDACAANVGRISGIKVEPVAATYLEGVAAALDGRPAGEAALVLFLGSTVGNFTRAQAATFMRELRSLLRSGDVLLVGADLVKSAAKLVSAYDDPIGVTAAFNLNLLARINRELNGEFEIQRFAHEARWNERARRIEMHLRSKTAQKVRVHCLGATFSFEEGETIWTESSHKFREGEIGSLAGRAGWAVVREWTEREWGFTETLLRIQ